MPENKVKVVVSRRWNKPTITATVSEAGIALELPLSEFLAALAAQIGSPAMIFTNAGLKDRINAAAEEVVREIKQASRQVM